MSFFSPLRGILLAYQNAELSSQPGGKKASSEPVYAKSLDEYAASFIWLTADFLLFRPERGTTLEGYITIQNENQISLLCYNQFNATIERKHLPPKWRWNGPTDSHAKKSSRNSRAESVANEEAEGNFVDGKGKPIDGLIQFRSLDFEAAASSGPARSEGFLMIEGTMRDKADEDKMRREEWIKQSRKAK